MANERRIRNNSVQGTLSSTMSAAQTTMNSAGLANLEAISSTEHAAIIIDPGRTAGAPEIVHVTAHTGSATSATIVRGREGTSARTHSSTEEWVHAPTAGTDYLPFRPPSVKVRSSASQDLASGSQTAVTFNTEIKDTDAMWSSTASARININTVGSYLLGGNVRFTDGSTAGYRQVSIRRSGSVFVASQLVEPTTANVTDVAVSVYSTASTSDYFELLAQQVSGTTNVDVTAVNEFSPSFWAIWQSS